MGVGAGLYVYDLVVKKSSLSLSLLLMSSCPALSSPATGYRGTCSLDFQQLNFFQFTLELHNLTATLCGCGSTNTFVHCIISRQTISMQFCAPSSFQIRATPLFSCIKSSRVSHNHISDHQKFTAKHWPLQQHIFSLVCYSLTISNSRSLFSHGRPSQQLLLFFSCEFDP